MTSSKEFPVVDAYYTEGRSVLPQQLGEILGERFRANAQEEIKERKTRLGNRQYQKMLDECRPFARYTMQAGFAPILTEISGFAQGAGIDFWDAFLLSTHEVFDPSDQVEEHCTTIATRKGKGILLGHNEDWPADQDKNNSLYILKAILKDTQGIDYSFLGLCYSLERPGTGVDINSHGLTQAINSLETNYALYGVPRIILARATTMCSTIKEVIDLVKTTKRASGYNLILAQGRQLANIEIAGELVAVDEGLTRVGLWVHTNGYLDERMQHLTSGESANSRARRERAEKLLHMPIEFQGLVDILSDHEGQYPILNPDTQATCIVNTEERILYVRRNNPAGNFVPYTLPSLQHP